jgi:hypothetical protein
LVLGSQFVPGRQVAIGPPSLEVLGERLFAGVFEAVATTAKPSNIITATYEYFFIAISPTSRTRPKLGDYLLCDKESPDPTARVDEVKIGDVPSPIMTTSSGDGLVVVSPLAAEIAPATIRVASAPMNVFFM